MRRAAGHSHTVHLLRQVVHAMCALSSVNCASGTRRRSAHARRKKDRNAHFCFVYCCRHFGDLRICILLMTNLTAPIVCISFSQEFVRFFAVLFSIFFSWTGNRYLNFAVTVTGSACAIQSLSNVAVRIVDFVARRLMKFITPKTKICVSTGRGRPFAMQIRRKYKRKFIVECQTDAASRYSPSFARIVKSRFWYAFIYAEWIEQQRHANRKNKFAHAHEKNFKKRRLTWVIYGEIFFSLSSCEMVD